MGSNKPNMEVRKPPADEETDPDKVAAFISGDDSERSGSSEVQTSGNSEGQKSKRVQTTVYLDDDVKRKLKAFCNLEGREMSAVVNELVAGELEDWSPEL